MVRGPVGSARRSLRRVLYYGRGMVVERAYKCQAVIQNVIRDRVPFDLQVNAV